jgi:hypothetical protein
MVIIRLVNKRKSLALKKMIVLSLIGIGLSCQSCAIQNARVFLVPTQSSEEISNQTQDTRMPVMAETEIRQTLEGITATASQTPKPLMPEEIQLMAENGEPFPALYFPPSHSPAPVIIFMHQLNLDMDQWQAIAPWLWGAGEAVPVTDPEEAWLDSSWFPENTLSNAPGVLIFTYRNCYSGCKQPQNKKILQDAQTALQYVLTLPETDTDQITIVGTSIGADAAIDSCFLLQDKTAYACKNVIAVSPGSYMQYRFESVAKVMVHDQTDIYCYASRADVGPAATCTGFQSSEHYHYFVGKGHQHGIELFSPAFEMNLLDVLLQAVAD